ncbi:MBL fold metallo-hydrolase [Streptomyces boninensis]|uniref:MBL fold metallo-hydrolase n=1 Tax=Streptomyces boninensis TaxID=2039455 RepID=UPI003B21385C
MSPTADSTPTSPVLPTLRLGRHTVTVIPDGSVQLHPRRWLPDSTPGDWQGVNAGLLDDDGFIEAPITALLVEHPDAERALLIDTGFGPHDIPGGNTVSIIGALRGGGLPDALDQVGCGTKGVGTVAFTHLHDDHFGWAFRAGPQHPPPFAEATLVASADEWAAAQDRPSRTRTATTGEEIYPGVTAWITPGHTRGHTSYVISGGARRLIAFGDVFHTPAQLTRPDWRVSMDSQPEQAVRTRYEMLAELNRPDTLAFANHFGPGQLGRVTESGGGLRWERYKGL